MAYKKWTYSACPLEQRRWLSQIGTFFSIKIEKRKFVILSLLNQKWGASAHCGLCLKVLRWEYERQCVYRRYKVDREYWASRLAIDIEIIVRESKQHIFNCHWEYTDIAGGWVRGESKSALALINLIISETKKVRELHSKFRLIDPRFYACFLPKSLRALGLNTSEPSLRPSKAHLWAWACLGLKQAAKPNIPWIDSKNQDLT